MYIFNKKRIIFINLSIIIAVFCYSFTLNKSNSTLVSSTPISGHTIILDAGHGSPDGGAVGDDGSIESILNLEIVLKLQKLLEASNCTIILTRSDENGIYEESADTIREKKISDMKTRAFIANNSNSELFLSIHMNKLNQSEYSGWQTFYKNNDTTSKEIAKHIQASFNNFMEKENSREIKSISEIYLTKNVDIPLVLVECGFLSNKEENELLQNEEYQNKLAWCIYVGLMDYFK